MAPAHLVSEIVCDGVGTLGTGPDEPTQIIDAEAVLHRFIPATDVSAIGISPHRILVTGGVTADGRVLPLTVLRYLDLATSSSLSHAWTDPVPLRNSTQTQTQASQKRRRKRVEAAYPVSRTAHTLTKAPDGLLYLIGGLKVGGREEGHPCKSIFALDHARETWASIDSPQASSKSKADRINFIGTRFAHVTVHYRATPSGRSARARARSSGPGSLLVHGGYVSKGDRDPVSTVHAFDIRSERWTIVNAQTGNAPARANHAAVILNDHYLVIHGGDCGDQKDQGGVSDELHVFDIQTMAWIQPQLHRSSQPGPSARKLHCAVNGIGPHEGSAVYYGGELLPGTFAESLHSLRLVEQDGNLTALWREHRVAPHNSSQVGFPFALASGALVASPDLAQYFVIGGRGPKGHRKYPIVIEANEKEPEECSVSAPSDSAPNSIPLRIRRQRPEPESHVDVIPSEDPMLGADDNGERPAKRGKHSMSSVRPSRLNRSAAAATLKAPASAKMKLLPTPGPLAKGVTIPRIRASSSLRNDTSLLEKSHKKIKSGVKRPRISPPAKPGASVETRNPSPSVARIVWTEPLSKADMVAAPGNSIEDDMVTPRGEPGPRSSRAEKASTAAHSTLSVRPVSVSNQKYTPSPNDDSAFAAPLFKDKQSRDHEEAYGANQMHEGRDSMVITGNNHASEVEVGSRGAIVDSIQDSIEEEFITSEALAQRGRVMARARVGGRNRARGTRGRGTGLVRTENAMSTELEEKVMELQKEKEKLKVENKTLANENITLKKDNRCLNEQCNDNLVAIREMRNIAALGEKEKGLGFTSPRQRSARQLMGDKALSALDRERDAKVAALRSQLLDKEEQLREVQEMNEKLNGHLKNVEEKCEALRQNCLKEKSISTANKELYDSARSQLVEYRDMVHQSAAAVEKHLRENAKLEAEIVEKNRSISDLNMAKSTLDRRMENTLQELSTGRREILSLQSSLDRARLQTNLQTQNEDQTIAKNMELEEKLLQIQKTLDEQKAATEVLKEKNNDLRGELKTSQSEHLDKIAECDRITSETRRANELTVEKQRELSCSLLEQTRLRKECDCLKVELQTLQRNTESERMGVTEFVSDLKTWIENRSTRGAPGQGADTGKGGNSGIANGTGGFMDSEKASSLLKKRTKKKIGRDDIFVPSSEGTEGSPVVDEEDPEP